MSHAREEGKRSGSGATPPSHYSEREKQEWWAGREAAQSAAPVVYGMLNELLQEHPRTIAVIVVVCTVANYIYSNAEIIELIIVWITLISTMAGGAYIALRWFKVKVKWVVLGLLVVCIGIRYGNNIWRKMTGRVSLEVEFKQMHQRQHRNDSIAARMAADSRKWNDSIDRVHEAERREQLEAARRKYGH